VEDDQIGRIVAGELLRTAGYEVEEAESGAQALEMLGTTRFDAVLMDITMPAMSGEEVTRRIRTDPPPGADPDVPVIALTAHALEGDRERFLEAGMDDYLTKPIDLEQLIDTLRRWIPEE